MKLECTWKYFRILSIINLRREDIKIVSDWKKDVEKFKDSISKPETYYQIYYLNLDLFVLMEQIKMKCGVNPDKELPKILIKACEEDKVKFIWFVYYFYLIPEYYNEEIIEKWIQNWNEWGVKKTHNFRTGIEMKRIEQLSIVNGDQYLKDLKDIIEELSKEENCKNRLYLFTAYKALLDHKSISIDYK